MQLFTNQLNTRSAKYWADNKNLYLNDWIFLFQNRCIELVIELRVVQFWSEIILVISNQTCAAHSFYFEITGITSDQIALHPVKLPLWTSVFKALNEKQD